MIAGTEPSELVVSICPSGLSAKRSQMAERKADLASDCSPGDTAFTDSSSVASRKMVIMTTVQGRNGAGSAFRGFEVVMRFKEMTDAATLNRAARARREYPILGRKCAPPASRRACKATALPPRDRLSESSKVLFGTRGAWRCCCARGAAHHFRAFARSALAESWTHRHACNGLPELSHQATCRLAPGIRSNEHDRMNVPSSVLHTP